MTTPDDTVIRDVVSMLDSIAATSARLRAVLAVLDGCDGREDLREARGKARQDVEHGFKILLSEAARLAALQPDIGKALTARGCG